MDGSNLIAGSIDTFGPILTWRAGSPPRGVDYPFTAEYSGLASPPIRGAVNEQTRPDPVSQKLPVRTVH